MGRVVNDYPFGGWTGNPIRDYESASNVKWWTRVLGPISRALTELASRGDHVAAWTQVTAFQNSWVDYKPTNAAYPNVGYILDRGEVHLRGCVSGGSAANTVIFTLPAALRPYDRRLFLVSTPTNGQWRVDIDPNGTVIAVAAIYGAGMNLDLSPIHFWVS